MCDLSTPDFRLLVTHARLGKGERRAVIVYPSDAVRQVLSLERLSSVCYKTKTKCAKGDVIWRVN